MFSDLSTEYYKDILKNKTSVSVEDAVFRNTDAFGIANLEKHIAFWEQEILKDHSHKNTILKWLQGVQLEEFLNPFTTGNFQGTELNFFNPPVMQLPNYVPEEFENFMNENVQECIGLGVLQHWNW